MFVIIRAPPSCNDAPLTIKIPCTVSVQLNGQPNTTYTDTTDAIDQSISYDRTDEFTRAIIQLIFSNNQFNTNQHYNHYDSITFISCLTCHSHVHYEYIRSYFISFSLSFPLSFSKCSVGRSVCLSVASFMCIKYTLVVELSVYLNSYVKLFH